MKTLLTDTADQRLLLATTRARDERAFSRLVEPRRHALGELPAFKRFQAGIADRCEVQPVVTELHEIGSFRFFDGQD